MTEHTNETKQKRFILSLSLTGFMFLAEVLGGFWTGSLALLADAAHVFMDAFALGLSYLALRAAALPANDRHTYGYHRLQILAALTNGITLLFISFEILREAWARWQRPQPIQAGPMLIIAVIGLIVNVIVAFVLHEHDHDDVNTRSAFLHVLGDTLASVGVIGAGAVILFTGWTWLDPLVSVLIGLLILVSAGRLLQETVHILAEGVPHGMTASAVAQAMGAVPGVGEIHDLHVWTVAPGYVALSAHVLLDDQALSETADVMADLKTILREQFNIEHTTIQFECTACDQGICLLAREAPQPRSR
ncbi:MAG: cation diffusion facilitator family transporter [Anaerolineae bacterium]